MIVEDWVYDIETYPNVFTIAFEHAEFPIKVAFEISDWRNESMEIVEFVRSLSSRRCRMVGFNNIGFDYPVLHLLLTAGFLTADVLYDKAMAIIESQNQEFNTWSNLVPQKEWMCYQLDLFKIHHFDNMARSTSLKALEFNMRSSTIEDLPFEVGTVLNRQQIDGLHKYNAHDVSETKKFLTLTRDMITFREELSRRYLNDFMNYNDTRIGKEYFIMKLKEAHVSCYSTSGGKREPIQTKRDFIHLNDAIMPGIKFNSPDLTRVLEELRSKTIVETKGVFKDITCKIGELDVIFGLGGIHGSLSSKIIESDQDHVIIDLDVTSYYPNLAIVNKFYPEHLGMDFVNIYSHLFEQRKKYKKGSPESMMLKLALNGVYGDSNNKYSVFYDPLFTMKITLNGQFLLCTLAENLTMGLPWSQLIQMNTDGLTIKLNRSDLPLLKEIYQKWESDTGLNLEECYYSKFLVRDVNNYIAVKEDGQIKRKGAYDYNVDWHQNASELVVPKVAEQALLHNLPIKEGVTTWNDLLDFMIRVKIPRSSKLVIEYPDGRVEQLQRTTRCVVSNKGGRLYKWMPPLKGGNVWRRMSVIAGYSVEVFNDLDGHEKADINYEYYIEKVEKLCLPMK